MYPITQRFINKNRSYQPLTIQGLVIHETANPGDSCNMEFGYFNNNDVQASAHAFIDASSIVQMIPWDEIGWHAGHTANHRFIGIECCHATNVNEFNIIYNNAVELFAYLFINVFHQTIVTPQNLMSHAECSNLWKETDHQDPISYFAIYNKTVDGFRADVQKQINSIITPPIPQWAIDCELFLRHSGFTTQAHNPMEAITMATFAYMINNYTTKQNIEPMKYLMDHNYTKSVHQPSEPISFATFSYMYMNKYNEQSGDVIQYLLNKGFITSPKNPQDIISFGVFGAMMQNALNKKLPLI